MFGERGPIAKELARECAELVALSVHRPYGTAWAIGSPDPKPKGGAQIVSLDPGNTPAAAFVLYWAGEFLDEPKYKDVAYQAARGIAASQRTLGLFPSRPIFLTTGSGGRDEVSLVADRSATRASLGLMLMLLDEAGGNDDMLKRSSLRAITWMIKQQSAAGAWPQSYPPATQPNDAVRLARLDIPDWRDCTLTMLLAYDLLQEPRQKASVVRSIDALLKLRVTIGKDQTPVLWSTAYGLDGFPTDRVAGFSPGIDVLASRNALQTLLATYLVLGELQPDDLTGAQVGQALVDGTDAIGKLPLRSGKWVRVYNFKPEKTEQTEVRPNSPFETPPAIVPPHLRTGDWGMTAMLAEVAAINGVGREKLIVQMNKSLPIHQRLAAAICGVEDDPLAVDWPTAADQVPAYLKAHPEFAADPSDLIADKVRRLWSLLNRAKLEKAFPSAMQ